MPSKLGYLRFHIIGLNELKVPNLYVNEKIRLLTEKDLFAN
jgi:hypothetical protein